MLTDVTQLLPWQGQPSYTRLVHKQPGVMSAKADIQKGPFEARVLGWIPACAGMTTGWGRKRQTLYKAT